MLPQKIDQFSVQTKKPCIPSPEKNLHPISVKKELRNCGFKKPQINKAKDTKIIPN